MKKHVNVIDQLMAVIQIGCRKFSIFVFTLAPYYLIDIDGHVSNGKKTFMRFLGTIIIHSSSKKLEIKRADGRLLLKNICSNTSMGISGLLPQLKSINKRVHLSKYRGQTIAIDAYCLLHKGAYSCARELVEGVYTDKHITYCMSRIELLETNGITPYVVFDGGPLPNKAEEEKARYIAREENREKARLLWRRGNKTAAIESYQKAVDITPAIANTLVARLASRGTQFVVAPFEADAQCAYLALNGMVDAVLTEDSDLLAYGCPRVLFKLDWNGDVDEISLADLPNCRDLNFVGWTQDLFQEMCVMAGCDFIKALPGIGIKKAHAHIRRTRDFVRALRALRFDGMHVPQEYESRFQRALWTFRHQRVYCPLKEQLVHLKEPHGGDITVDAAIPSAALLGDGEEDFLGPVIEDHIVKGIAEGRLDPMTHTSFLQPLADDVDGVDGGDDLLNNANKERYASLSARRHYKKPRQADEDGGYAGAGEPGRNVSLKKSLSTKEVDARQSSVLGKRKSSLPLHAIAARHFPSKRNAAAAVNEEEYRNDNGNPSNYQDTSLRKRLQASLNAVLSSRNSSSMSGGARYGEKTAGGVGGRAVSIWRPQTATSSGDEAAAQEDIGYLVTSKGSITTEEMMSSKTPSWAGPKSGKYSGVTPGFYSS